MLRFSSLRLALSAVLTATVVPAAIHAQSENSQSVAEAARRTREQKKAAAKPAKVITEDDVKPASSDAMSATATSAQPATDASNASAAAAQPNSSGAQGPKNPTEAEKVAKERAELKEKIKQAESDLDLLQRELRLDQDSFYSNPNYAGDNAGKEKLDALKQQISDKQQDLDRLKTQLAALPESQETSTTTPPKS